MKKTHDNFRTNYRDSYGFGVFGKSLLFLQIQGMVFAPIHADRVAL